MTDIKLLKISKLIDQKKIEEAQNEIAILGPHFHKNTQYLYLRSKIFFINKLYYLAIDTLLVALEFEQKEEIAGCIHAGWKGAINGVIENTLMKLREIGGNPEELVVCIGPCIGKQSYEVKEDFYSKFKR